MKLEQGQKAIDFTVNNIFGKEINLSDYKGKKIFLTFLRNVSCPFCNVRVHQLMGNSVRFRATGLETILFFESAPEKIKASVLHQGLLPWEIIGDPEKIIYSIYGVETSMIKMMRSMVLGQHKGAMKLAKTLASTGEKDKNASKTLIPADFLINEDFEIAQAKYGTHAADHISIEEIAKFAGI